MDSGHPPPIQEVNIPPMQVACPHCQAQLELSPTHAGRKITCPRCGGISMAPLPTAIQGGGNRAGQSQNAEFQSFVSKKIAAGICGILLGCLGVHKFILGFTTPGIIMLLVSVLSCGWAALPMALIGLIEGIIYLTKSDEDFYQSYAFEERGWF